MNAVFLEVSPQDLCYDRALLIPYVPGQQILEWQPAVDRPVMGCHHAVKNQDKIPLVMSCLMTDVIS